MRSFHDATGRPWQAALLDASYGRLLLVFSAMRGSETRCRDAEGDNRAQAEALLAALDDAGLRDLLAASEPWDPARGGP